MKEFLTGPNGEQSSKRLFTLILMFLWVVYFFSNLYWKFILRDTFEDQLFYMILVFYVGISWENWLSRRKPADKVEPPKETP